MKHCFSKMVILGIIAAWQLSGGTIASDTNTTGTSALTGGYWGETFQTPAGGPWNTLTFNFFSDSAATTAEATGILYLLNLEYLGTPSDLSSSTPGFIGSTAASGGLWTFNPSLSVSAGTEYWVYVDTAQPTIYGGVAAVANQGPYYTDSSADPYFALTDTDVNFNFSGSTGEREDTPEPTTLLLMAPALLLVLRRRLAR